MKTPEQLAQLLTRQWQDAKCREQRLLDREAWPVRLPIGRPSAATFTHDTARLREHVARWRAVVVGEVEWKAESFRSGTEAVSVPRCWLLHTAEQWAQASANADVRHEQQQLHRLLEKTPTEFHPLLVRQRGLWRGRSEQEVLLAAALVMELQPGMAQGMPMRALALAGIDSKFIERNRTLVTAMADLRFEGRVSAQGLGNFLGAAEEGEHWLLVVPLAEGLLPFAQQRVRARELAISPLCCESVLLIENERCLHLLPTLPGTIAVLGSGLDLAWLEADWLCHRRLGYWGDMDSWGLQMLARARQHCPHLRALLMEQALFEQHADRLAVVEPTPAEAVPAAGLEPEEMAFLDYLLGQHKGRIEQEFLPRQTVVAALQAWRGLVD